MLYMVWLRQASPPFYVVVFMVYKHGINVTNLPLTRHGCVCVAGGGSLAYMCVCVCALSWPGTQQGIFSGQQQPQHQQQQQLNSITQMANALVMPLVFGDNRDLTIKKFNQVQAYCGQGKGIVNHTQSIDFSQDNPYCRFKVHINNIALFVYKIYLYL